MVARIVKVDYYHFFPASEFLQGYVVDPSGGQNSRITISLMIQLIIILTSFQLK